MRRKTLLRNIGSNCAMYRMLHDTSAHVALRRFQCIQITLLVLSVILSAEAVFRLLQNSVSNILQTILIFVVALLSTLNNFIKYQERAEQHKTAKKAYATMYTSILTTLLSVPVDADIDLKILKQFMSAYDALEVESPDVSNRLLEAYKTNDQSLYRHVDIEHAPVFNCNNQSNIHEMIHAVESDDVVV